NQMLPSRPMARMRGPLFGRGRLNSSMVPASGLMRPIRLPLNSQNHRCPPGPAAMSWAPLLRWGRLYSVTVGIATHPFRGLVDESFGRDRQGKLQGGRMTTGASAYEIQHNLMDRFARALRDCRWLGALASSRSRSPGWLNLRVSDPAAP